MFVRFFLSLSNLLLIFKSSKVQLVLQIQGIIWEKRNLKSKTDTYRCAKVKKSGIIKMLQK